MAFNTDSADKTVSQMAGKKTGPRPRVLGARRLFDRKNPGSPGKLGKTSTVAESLSKLRGKGAVA